MPLQKFSPATLPTILLSVGETVDSAARSGIHRVVVELARTLAAVSNLHLVRWDAQAGQLRPIDHDEFDRLFGCGRWPAGLRPHPAARRVAYRFSDLWESPEETWLIDPEVGHHIPDRMEAFAKALSQCRERGIRVATVFYDQIPLSHAAYQADKAAHLRYLAEISRADLILPISRWSARTLEDFYAGLGLAAPDGQIRAAPLAEARQAAPAVAGGQEADKRLILMVGTVEPRKRQVEFLRAFARAQKHSAAAREMRVLLAGSLHPAVAREFEALVQANPSVDYLRYAPDEVIADRLKDTAFTAFVSEDEGFGLPIAESLAAGLPCLCANFGAMAEVAEGGGCLTVDVRQEAALEEAIVRLSEDVDLRLRLRSEIAARALRTWDDYARDIVRELSLATPGAATPAQDVRVAQGDVEDVETLAASDVAVFSSTQARDAFVAAAAEAGVKTLLPSRLAVGEAEGARLTAELSAFRQRLARIARVEKRYAALRQALAGEARERPVFLRVVLSTYNRRDFVIENIKWLLAQLPKHGDLEIAVVDNASTDGTAEAIEQMFRGTRLRWVVNPANVGMLGNMRECSLLQGAEYVWLVGDDDFIVPQQFDAIVDSLKRQRGVPLAYLNFGVYYRQALGPADTPERVMAEKVLLAERPIASGVYPVRTVAAQHDNLFTAIYINIWRSDVLSAAYDHTFAGKPFVNLVESIPCTKTILESFGECDSYWHAPVSIVGNAHNSWVRHRPRWHALLMPQALALARDAGVDAETLWPWARLQGELYDEARGLAADLGLGLDMSEADAFDISWPTFRRRLVQSASK